MTKTLPVLIALWLLCGASAALAQSVPTSEPVIRPGDRVQVMVWRNPELSGTFDVSPAGTLSHPLYQHVPIAGVPLATAQQRLVEYLQRFEEQPRLLFTPEYRIFVGGMVRNQSQFHLPEMSVAEALTRAGGSTAPDRQLRLRLIRDGHHSVVAMNDPAAAEVLQAPIRSGDQILLEQRPTFTRTYLGPALQTLQTVTALVATYIYLDALFGS
jgi:protein involved in polysaccharide export with SLBB domain